MTSHFPTINKNPSQQQFREEITPPLPLFRFNSGESNQIPPRTVTGENIKSIPNTLNVGFHNCEEEKLADPIAAKRLAKWFVARCHRETNYKQMEQYNKYYNIGSNSNCSDTPEEKPDVFDYPVYESYLYVENAEERIERNKERLSEEQVHYNRMMQTMNNGTTDSASNSDDNSDSGSIRGATSGSSLSTDNSANQQGSHHTTTLPSITSSSTNSSHTASSSSFAAAMNALPPSYSYSSSLTFDSEFESGNLEMATRVIGRDTLMNTRSTDYLSDYQIPTPVDQEYDLLLRNDINTNGNIQWYYFSVTLNATNMKNIVFPWKVRFNIVNMQKKDSLYNYGMKPAVFSVYQHHKYQQQQAQQQYYATHHHSAKHVPGYFGSNGSSRHGHGHIHGGKSHANMSSTHTPNTNTAAEHSYHPDWYHDGYDICYYRNGAQILQSNTRSSKKKSTLRPQYTFTFTYTFHHSDTVYFAYTYPYTYSDLQAYLASLEKAHEMRNFFHRRALCYTLAGNRCDVITITERTEGIVESRNKPSIVLSARIHPGESNASYMIHGFLEFLCSDCDEAMKLRRSFIFTIVPMLNPDGVIHGNYRCSLAGTDLNRRYQDAHPSLHPTIVTFRELMKTINNNRPILLYLDLHGHSKLKNSFIYGCDVSLQPEKYVKYFSMQFDEEEMIARRIQCRIFPRILCTLSRSNGGSGSGSGMNSSLSTTNLTINTTTGSPVKSTTTTSASSMTDHHGYFSYKDCAFTIDKGKFGTGRVVSWRDIGILGAYTIEASFCGNGDNNEKRLLKKYFEFKNNPIPTGNAAGSSSTKGNSKKGKTTGKQSNSSSQYNNPRREEIRVSTQEMDLMDDGMVGLELMDDSNSNNNYNSNSNNNYSNTNTFPPPPATAPSNPSSSSSSAFTASSFSSSSSSRKSQASQTHHQQQQELIGSINTLLQNYQHSVHYQKADLLLMGQHIGKSIFHYCNLTHADLELEREILIQTNLEMKDKIRREQQILHDLMHRGSSMAMASSQMSYYPEMVTDEVDVELEPPPPMIPMLSNMRNTHNDGNDNGSDIDGDEEEEEDNEEDDEEGNTANNNNQNNSDDEPSAGRASSQAVSSSSSSRKHSKIGGNVVLSALKIIEYGKFFASYLKTKVDLLHQEDIASRAIWKSSILSPAILQMYIRDYLSEFLLVNAPTSHIGLRIKSEYVIRKLLKIQDNIASFDALDRAYVKQQMKQQQQSPKAANVKQQEKDENASVDGSVKIPEGSNGNIIDMSIESSSFFPPGTTTWFDIDNENTNSGDESESNPSVDNPPASKLLKNMSKCKNTNSLVAALQVAIKKKKCKEEALQKKHSLKMTKKLIQQAEQAKKKAEAEKALNGKVRPSSANSISNRYRMAAAAKRRTSIVSSIPKFAPLYRLAPSELKTNVPVTIRTMHFRDVEGPIMKVSSTDDGGGMSEGMGIAMTAATGMSESPWKLSGQEDIAKIPSTDTNSEKISPTRKYVAIGGGGNTMATMGTAKICLTAGSGTLSSLTTTEGLWVPRVGFLNETREMLSPVPPPTAMGGARPSAAGKLTSSTTLSSPVRLHRKAASEDFTAGGGGGGVYQESFRKLSSNYGEQLLDTNALFDGSSRPKTTSQDASSSSSSAAASSMLFYDSNNNHGSSNNQKGFAISPSATITRR